MLKELQQERVWTAIERFTIELPSWGFANTGTRFGKFMEASAAITTADKLSDAAEVHKFTGCCPSIAMHVLWDFPKGPASAPEVCEAAARLGIRVGAINPNIFQDQMYKHGSFGNPDPVVREAASRHMSDCVAISKVTGSRDISLWFADGSSYPGTANIRHRRQWFIEGLQRLHSELDGNQRMLVEYKPFEPAFYHTDIADWGMAVLLARHSGPNARVLVDTGHHYQAVNIEQIVAWLLAEGMLGGFHFNDRRYADDDLTIGSIDPYQVFRIFQEIHCWEWENGTEADIAYMIDQSHNLKPKTEEMIQTAATAQELYAKAALVDQEALAPLQTSCKLIDAEECLRRAFFTDVTPIIRDWRVNHGLAPDPLQAFRESGYLERVRSERAPRQPSLSGAYA